MTKYYHFLGNVPCVSYSKVCGRLLAYQVGAPNTFSKYFNLMELVYLMEKRTFLSFVVVLQEDYKKKTLIMSAHVSTLETIIFLSDILL